MNTEESLKTIRDALVFDAGTLFERRHTRGLAALDFLTDELERVSYLHDLDHKLADQRQTKLDKALSALREIEDTDTAQTSYIGDIVRRVFAELEGEGSKAWILE